MLSKEIWNGWKVENLIGEGSFGKVYKIVREDFGHIYVAALKVIQIPYNKSEVKAIKSEGLTDESVTSYFKSMVEDIVEEFSIMSKLKGNSNIVSYEDHMVVPKEGEFGWDIYIRMELLTPLMDYVENHEMKVKDVVQLGIDICSALEVCKRYDIIHRDIKPENIFVSDMGSFKLGDFGIARQLEKTMSGLSKKGTYTYMAPEVYKGMSYNSSVDLYSLGIVMYRFLNNNRSPFMPPVSQQIKFSDREEANIRRFSGEKLEKPSKASERLSNIILKACEYKSGDRYSFPEQMKKDLMEYLNAENEEVLNSIVIAKQENEDEEKTPVSFGTHSSYLDDEPTEFMQPNFEKYDETIEDEGTVLMSSNDHKSGIEQEENKQEPETALNFRKKEEKLNAEKKKNSKIKIVFGVIASVVALTVIITLFVTLGNEKTKEVVETTTIEKVYVPSVENMSMSEAVAILNEHGFKLSVVQEVYSDNVEGGVIISQSPKGTEEAKGNTIEVVLSKGTELVKVPYVVGMKKSKAESELKELGFILKISKEYSDVYEKGKVVEQSYEAGTELKKGSTIKITVSKGESPKEDYNTDNSVYTYSDYSINKSDEQSEKKTDSDSSKKNETTKVIKKIGNYKESNVLSSSKISVLRNSINISGSENSEYTNLAKYMANNGLSNASSAYYQLTNTNKSLNQKTYSFSISSSSDEDILEVAAKLTDKISASKYGVGISSTAASVGYKIFIVVVYD